MNERKILEINQVPFLREAHNSAFSFAVLETNKLSKSWILENFLLIKFSVFLTYSAPFFLKWKCFSRKAIVYLPNTKISNSIIKYINKGYYVYMELNEFYIPNRKSYKTIDFYHDILIYGFDMHNSNFLTIAYNNTGMFSPQWVSFKDINDAYLNYKMRYSLKAMPFRVSDKYDFSKKNHASIIKKLDFMLHTKKEHFGMNSYGDILKHINNIKTNKNKIDLRSFRTLCEHQKVLLLFNDVFKINKNLYNMLLNLNEQGSLIFNLAIKYDLTSNEDILCKIEAQIIYLIEKTKTALASVYDYLLKC